MFLATDPQQLPDTLSALPEPHRQGGGLTSWYLHIAEHLLTLDDPHHASAFGPSFGVSKALDHPATSPPRRREGAGRFSKETNCPPDLSFGVSRKELDHPSTPPTRPRRRKECWQILIRDQLPPDQCWTSQQFPPLPPEGGRWLAYSQRRDQPPLLLASSP
jgi:hypothetical protein